MLERVISSPDYRRLLLSVELQQEMARKYSPPKAKAVSKKGKTYKVIITIESIEEV